MPRVSVVISAYNSARFLPVALQSVLSQTFSDFELIVVDDGSTDDTCEIVAEYSDPRVRYIYQENRGLPAARNAGLQAAQGAYIAFLDADDAWLPEKLAGQIRLLDARPEVGLVYCGACKIREGKVIAEAEPKHRGQVVRALLTIDNIVTGSASAALVRRECFDRAGLFDEARIVFEDWDMWLRIAQLYPFDYVAESLVRIRIHGESMQHQSERMKAGIQSFFDHVLAAPAFADEVRPVERRVRGLENFLLGRVCCNAGEMREARRYLLRSVRYNPFRAWAWAYLGAALLGRRPLAWLRAARTRAFRLLQWRHEAAV